MSDLLVPDITDATRREVLAALGAAGLLTACGARGAGPSAGPVTRTVTTPRGPVDVPVDPRRVVALYTHDVGNALVLGLPVVAGAGETGQPAAGIPDYLVEAFPQQTADIVPLSTLPEPNVEEIAALQPDVILSGIFGAGANDVLYDRLDAIAPTVTYQYSDGEDFVNVPWREVLRENGAAFGREDAAEEWIAGFESRAVALRERIAARWAGASVAVVLPQPDQIYLPGSELNHVLVTLGTELGLPLASSLTALLGEDSTRGGSVSYERLGELDADIVFVPVFAADGGGENRAGLDVLLSQPLWSRVPAARDGRVYEFTGDIFYESGPMATAFLDVVERTLLA